VLVFYQKLQEFREVSTQSQEKNLSSKIFSAEFAITPFGTMKLSWSPTCLVGTLLVTALLYCQYRTWNSPRVSFLPQNNNQWLRPLKTRQEIGRLLQEQGEEFRTGLEVGVQHGYNAKEILSQWNHCTTFYLVDTWAQEPNYSDWANQPNEEQEKIYRAAKELLSPWEDKTHFIRKKGIEAARTFRDAGVGLDFVFLDARHDYCAVREDLETFYPLLKPNGIMAGHDYLEAKDATGQDWTLCATGERHQGAVKGAVDGFTRNHNHQLVITYQDSPWNTWMFRKEEKKLL
jgi:hypothetical protein